MLPNIAPTDSQPVPQPLWLWPTDRTRFKVGVGRCARARYLGYHFDGVGLAPKAESLPLATGLYTHQGVEAFGRILAEQDRLPTLEETREIVARVRAAYVAKVEARGFLGILGGEQTTETILEQSALISGLLWALRLKLLPWLHQTYRLLSVEQERLHFLSCTCGAGPLDADEHVRRECQGVVLMLRSDLLAQRRGATTLAYFEVKTTGWESSAWAEQWEIDPQLGLGTLDVDRLFGAEVAELYIVGLNKGPRRREKDEPEGRRKQLSALCYGYRRPGNPPLLAEEWLPSYEWTTDDGETKRASRAHRRAGVWEIPTGDSTTWRAYSSQDPSLSPEEFWVRLLPASVLDKVCFLLGPMNRQDQQIASVRRAMLGEEARWQQVLWDLYALQQTHPWASDAYQARLDTLVPQSWQCRPFGKEHQCAFVPICCREAGWDDPLASDRYEARRPHHVLEADQWRARGIVVDGTGSAEGDEA